MKTTMKNRVLKRAAVIICTVAALVMIMPTAMASDNTLLKTGSSGSAVTSLQSRLLDLGYFDSSVATGYFGALTKTAVIRFQNNNGLSADGIAGSATNARIYSSSAINLILNIGSRGEVVGALQQRLKNLGYFISGVTGYYGSATKSAVSIFQKKCGLTADGIAGPATRVSLFSASAPVNSGVSAASTNTGKIADIALAQTGKPYVYSTEGPSTFDCSGLAYYSLTNSGFSVQRLSASGFSECTSWARITGTSSLQKGDLIFFRSDTSAYISHMGIYTGSGQFAQASSGQGKVIVSSLSNVYWAKNYMFARRVS